MINTLFSAILQLLVFSLIPLLVYLIRYRKLAGFLDYIGLKPSPLKANMLALLITALIALPIIVIGILDEQFLTVLTDPKSVTGQIRQIADPGQTIITVLIMAILKTALAEEIFFRGFVAKRLIALLGFQAGNWLQAVLFGLLHGVLFLSVTDNPLFIAVIFIFPTLGAYFKAYLNEKLANGSIIPGWIAHASGNLVAYSYVAFFV